MSGGISPSNALLLKSTLRNFVEDLKLNSFPSRKFPDRWRKVRSGRVSKAGGRGPVSKLSSKLRLTRFFKLDIDAGIFPLS
jgi:hypothetical protein